MLESLGYKTLFFPFVQAAGIAHVLADEAAPSVRARHLDKLAWSQTYTPVVPVRIDLARVVVSSLARGWFPGRKLQLDT